MTVHTHIQRRHSSVFGVQRIAVAIQTADLVDPGVYFMRVEDRLLRLVTLLPAQANSAFYYPVTTQYKQDEYHKGDIGFIPVEGNRLSGRNTPFVIGQVFQDAVSLWQAEHDDSKNKRQDAIEQCIVAFGAFRTGAFRVRSATGSIRRRLIGFHIL